VPDNAAKTKQVTIKPLSPGKVKQVESALALLESLLGGEWAEAATAWRAANPEQRTADKAPLFARLASLAKQVS